jgi:asparagine synthase (glutamine-hydrolysing)
MCGISGFLQAGLAPEEWPGRLQNMAQVMRHRGPDDRGEWYDAEAGVGLAHRRLAIVDLSPAGHQPMHSVCGRFVIAFNGEIYNHLEIRKSLDMHSPSTRATWRGHSDTEVMLTAISQWGLEEALACFNGMFAFALWDRQERVLCLARDRLGEKPLYYGWMGRAFLFGSELKALKTHPHFRMEIDRNAVALFMRYNCIPAPYSIYQGILKLPPGTLLRIQPHDGARAELVSYWSARAVVDQGVTRPFAGMAEQAIDHLDTLLREAVSLRMVADVPLGAFLSGGVDSSTIVALMQAQSQRPIKTFSIGLHQTAYDEAQHAKQVAHHLGTEHTELYVTPAEAMAVIPHLPTLYDEPFADSSQIPTFLVSQLARQQVTVTLSGDGGDELFGGYNRYFWGRSLWHTLAWFPQPLRRLAARLLTAVAPACWEQWFRQCGRWLPAKMQQRTPGDKLHKLADVLAVDGPEALYQGLVSHWKHPAMLVSQAQEPLTPAFGHVTWNDQLNFTQLMMYLDLISYLPDDILVKVDRASMAVSLEARVPFLDHRVVEFAWHLPLSMKLRHGQGKWLLRQVLYKYIPRTLIERPKSGFGIPLDAWLRGPLRDWGEALLSEQRLRQEGFFNPLLVREKWQEHLSGKRNWQHHLWDVLMFQAWLEAQQATLPLA